MSFLNNRNISSNFQIDQGAYDEEFEEEKNPFKLMNERELLQILAQILEILPAKQLKDMNLEEEIVLQYRTAKALQDDVVNDSLMAPNHKAQIMNSVASTLQMLVKMQSEYYTAERLKKIEMALVRTLNAWPHEQSEQFLDAYAEILEKA